MATGRWWGLCELRVLGAIKSEPDRTYLAQRAQRTPSSESNDVLSSFVSQGRYSAGDYTGRTLGLGVSRACRIFARRIFPSANKYRAHALGARSQRRIVGSRGHDAWTSTPLLRHGIDPCYGAWLGHGL